MNDMNNVCQMTIQLYDWVFDQYRYLTLGSRVHRDVNKLLYGVMAIIGLV